MCAYVYKYIMYTCIYSRRVFKRCYVVPFVIRYIFSIYLLYTRVKKRITKKKNSLRKNIHKNGNNILKFIIHQALIIALKLFIFGMYFHCI